MAAARKPIISGNWKMHHNHFEAIQTVQKLAYLIHKDDYDEVDVSVHPPFTDLRSVQTGQTSSQWLGSFARFPMQDHTAPGRPTVPSAVM